MWCSHLYLFCQKSEMDKEQSYKLEGFLVLLVVLSSCQGFRPLEFKNRPATGEIGCFKDSSRSSDLSVAGIKGAKGMTKRLCRRYCEDAWYDYAAVQNGDTCWCGNDYGKYGKVDLSECHQKPCTGDKTEHCGGLLRNLLMYSGFDSDSEEHSRDVNKCWYVASSNCAPVKYRGDLKSREQCRSLCGFYRKKFAAVDYSDMCLCDDDFFGGVVKEARMCGRPCQGNRSEICGGNNRNMFIMHSKRDVNDRGLLLAEGCYVDSPFKPLLDAKEVSLNDDTPESSNGKSISRRNYKIKKCQEKCKQNQFKLAAVKGVPGCWCSNTFNNKAMLTDQKHCSKPCPQGLEHLCFWLNYMFVTDSGLKGKTPTVKEFHDRTHGRHSCNHI